MSNVYVWKQLMQKVYSKYGMYLDKILRLLLGLFVFGMINSKIGYMESVAKGYVTVGLAALCAFLPVTFMAVFAAVLVLLHLSAVSLPVVAVSAAVFLVMFVFYFQLAPGTSVLLLLTPLAFVLKIPCVIPIACGLMGAPSFLVPMVCGTIVYFMLGTATSASSVKESGVEGLLGTVITFAKNIFENKEMLVTVAALVLCFLFVYTVRRSSIDHAWKAAIVSGTIVHIVSIIIGEILFDIPVSYGTLIAGNVLAAAVGFLLELFVFTVDYSRSEFMQFEDDEYYYYVKAVPKISVSAPEKTVKKINERQNTEAAKR